jgi:hypothetical protein
MAEKFKIKWKERKRQKQEQEEVAEQTSIHFKHAIFYILYSAALLARRGRRAPAELDEWVKGGGYWRRGANP